MKILLHSYNFYPMIGGIETVSDTLASHFTEMGIHCTVVTQSRATEQDDRQFNFRVVRNPSFREKYKLAKEHDVVFSNGTSMAMVVFALLARKKFCWALQTYQLITIDGAGWDNGHHAPMTPFKSFLHYFLQGKLLMSSVGAFKMLVRRFTAIHICSANIAITEWVAKRTKMPHQVVIYNPFPLAKFNIKTDSDQSYDYDFLFLGRLVSEKGADVLIEAMSLLIKSLNSVTIRLGLIGDGPDRQRLQNLATDLGVASQVDFIGKKTGEALVRAVRSGRIAIVPSTWEEPMGGVALEMLSAGKNIIVAQDGGLAELIEGAGLTFKNGDANDLKAKMQMLLNDPSLRNLQLQRAKIQLAKFKERRFVEQYADLFKRLIEKDQTDLSTIINKPSY